MSEFNALVRATKCVEMIQVPDRKDFSTFARYNASNGYIALGPAYQSYKIKRSTNSVTLLLLGLSGAGKSHIVNNIFNTPITSVGEGVSCTKEILEFVIELPSENLGISNSEIHVIDTPGFGDTERGLEFDAKVLANVDKLFKEKGFIPNFILLAVNITDKRLEGQFAPFVKLLQAIKRQLSGAVLDLEHPNLLVVLTHLCSMIPKFQRDPLSKKEIIQRLVRENIGIASVHVEFAENMSDEYELEKIGEYYQLPNGDLFPRNIYQSLVKIGSGTDPIGHGLLNEAYPKLQSAKLPVKQFVHAIVDVPSLNSVVEGLLRLQIYATTELGDRLSACWSQLCPDEQSNCRLKPTEFAQKLSILGYKNHQDLPRMKKQTVQFFREIAPDDQMAVLLRRAFGIEAPTISCDLLVGQAFDLTKDCPTSFVVLSSGDMNLATVGLYIPSSIVATDHNEVKFTCHVTKSKREMTEQRLRELKINANLGKWQFSFGHRDGYNVFSQGSNNTLTAVYEKRLIKLEMGHTSPVSEELKTAVQKLPSNYDKHSEHNVNQWKYFFSTYGTHYIKTAYIGGSVVFHMTNISGSLGQSNYEVNPGGISGFLASVFSANCTGSETSSSSASFNEKNLEITVRGGNSTKASELASSSTKEQFYERLNAWEDTIWDDPAVADSSVTLGAIADVVNRFESSLVNGMKEAALDLYNSRLEYEAKNELVEPTRQQDSDNNKDEGTKCLTAQTLIATPTEPKPIAILKSGDFVLDKDGRPARVVAVNKVYTCGRALLYGFDEISPFFTCQHTFLHPSGSILVQNKTMLREFHPQMQTEFDVIEMPTRNIEVLTVQDGRLVAATVPFLTSLEMDNDEELYFLAVEGEGTYVANGFVCYHELPIFDAWPQTFLVIFETVKMLDVQNPHVFTKHEFDGLFKLSVEIKGIWQMLVNNHDTTDNDPNISITTKNSFNNAMLHLAEVLNNAHQANLGMMLYSGCGMILHRFIEVDKTMSPRPFVQAAQDVMAGCKI
ncbi:uncharacterized protein LOC119078725 [Bradysia coprophila]|uniref:uncharacterized protein LOC119078725 n=1 Tax=Bradysia coprophila TaxID=38358 RepID=UPI00187D85FA|nr:uncharacterized protein LOC119078725 [Bradysia coprophila]